MVFKKPYKLIKNLFYNLTFRKLNQAKYLFVVDKENEKYPIKDSEYYIIGKFYIRYFDLRSIFLFKDFKKNYFKTIVKKLGLKKIISNHVNVFAYNFKKNSPDLEYFIYQHSYIYDFEIKNYEILYKNIIVNKFFAFDQRHVKIFNKILKSNFYVIGSFRNNFIKLKNKYIKNQINYISEYRGKYQSTNSKNNEKKIIFFLHKYSKKRKYYLFISLNANRSDKIIDRKSEISYFKKYSKDFNYNKANVYDNSLDSIISFSMSSNAGLEILSRKIPLIYLDLMSKSSNKFKNPYYKKLNKFYINRLNSFKSFETKIDNLIKNLNDDNIKIIDPIKFNKNNTIFIGQLYK